MHNRFYSFLITHPFLNVKSRDEFHFFWLQENANTCVTLVLNPSQLQK